MEVEEPFVSICLLTYKRAAVLARSLDSLLNQTHQNFELIINDDCSPDATEALARAYERRDARVRYCRNERNLGYAGNQNAALATAKADFIAIVHDGDIYRADCVAQWVRVMQDHPQIGIVYNASDELDQHDNVIMRHRHPYALVTPGKAMLDEMLRLNSSPIFGIVLLRRRFIAQAGRFDERYPVLADVDMWMRLLMVSDVAYINEPLYQIHAREADHVNRGVNWEIIREHQQIFESNARRRFARRPEEGAAVLRELNRKFDRQLLRAWVWCLRRRKWTSAKAGCLCLRRSYNRALRCIGRSAYPWLRLLVKPDHI